MRGRKPTPKAVLKLQGTLRPYRHSDSADAEPLIDLPIPPDYLTHGAKVIWSEYLPYLIHMRVISNSDLANFESYCVLVDTMRRLHQELTVPQLSTLANSISKLGSDFGFTPASRARITPIPKQDSAEEKAKYFS